MLAILSLTEQARAEPVTITIIGDSLVQGYGLPAENGFVPQLQNTLTSNGIDVILLNAGVSGDTTAGGLSRVEWALTPDVDGVIVSLGGNDLLRGFDPAFSRSNLQMIVETAIGRGLPVLLVGIKAPSNYGADYKADFDAIYPDLSDEHETLLYPNFLAALFALPDRSATLANFMQADSIHPNAKGVALIVQDMAPIVGRLVQRISQPE